MPMANARVTTGLRLNTCLMTVNSYVMLTNSVATAGLWALFRSLACQKRAPNLPGERLTAP
jgi:hypothetical protein